MESYIIDCLQIKCEWPTIVQLGVNRPLARVNLEISFHPDDQPAPIIKIQPAPRWWQPLSRKLPASLPKAQLPPPQHHPRPPLDRPPPSTPLHLAGSRCTHPTLTRQPRRRTRSRRSPGRRWTWPGQSVRLPSGGGRPFHPAARALISEEPLGQELGEHFINLLVNTLTLSHKHDVCIVKCKITL